jgi:hypothetical protein
LRKQYLSKFKKLRSPINSIMKKRAKVKIISTPSTSKKIPSKLKNK